MRVCSPEQSAVSKIRVGVIGGGFGQHVHVPAFRADARASVDAICVSTLERAQAIAGRLNISRAFGDWRALVADPRIDAVAISVPPSMQAEIVLEAASRGKHVFAEKPMAENAKDAQRMCDSVAAAGVVGVVDFEFREVNAWKRLKAMLNEGAVGTLRHVYLSWRVETVANRERSSSWKRDASRGGGALSLFGSHALDSVLWAFGRVERVTARTWAPDPGMADTRVEAWLETVGGVLVSMSLATDAPFGSGYSLEIYGDDGALALRNRTADYASGFSLTLAQRGKPTKILEVEPHDAGADGRVVATASVVRRFLDGVQTGAPAKPDFNDGLSVQQLMDAIRAAEGSRVCVHLN